MLKKHTYIFSLKAEMELNQAIDWFDLQRFGLRKLIFLWKLK